MSAIWGTICRNATIPDNFENAFSKRLTNYKFDRISTLKNNTDLFICGHQFLSSGSKCNISPINSDKQIVFNADCILFNRNELFGHLDMSPLSENEIGDDYLAYLLFLKYGAEFVKLLRGSFAFAAYWVEKRELQLFTDHFYSRYLQYSISDDYVCYGTTCDSFNLLDINQINKEFLANAYANSGPIIYTSSSQTQYEGIYRLKPATIVSINVNTKNVKENVYWDPMKIQPKTVYSSEKECREHFISVFKRSVEQMLCSAGKTGITLSGGLDSSSVAALAAPALAKRGENLYSYTQIPVEDFTKSSTADMAVDESIYVKAQCEMYANIVPSFLSSQSNNCFDYLKEFTELYNIPLKPFANLPHIHRMLSKAYEDGCKIVLGGGNGNSTVSYGTVQDILAINFTQFHWLSFYRNSSALCKLNRESKKTFYLNWFGKGLANLLARPKNKTILNADSIKTYKIQNRNRKRKKRFGITQFKTYGQSMNYRFDHNRFVQYSYFRTMQSLLYGVGLLDPTMTVEIVEFCFSLDLRYYYKNGIDRRLIRSYMYDMIPPLVTSVHKPFGLQAADFSYCINRDYDKIKAELYNSLQNNELNTYLDSKTVQEYISQLKEHEGANSHDTLWNALMISTLSYFIGN